ncbi:MAG: thioesterase family protein [Pseudomonadota bacterium]
MAESLTFQELIASIEETEAGLSVDVPLGWMQGRTLYGGLSAALCYEAALRCFDEDAPPLRSASVSFNAPAGGRVGLDGRILRQGRSVSFVEADVIGEKGIATRSVFAFGKARQSKYDHMFIPAPGVPDPDDCPPFFPDGAGPPFAQNFETRLARGALPVSGALVNDHYIWIRFREDDPLTMTSLMAIADMPPPAMLPMFDEFGPISSMTWLFNILTDAPKTKDGWWLFQTRAEHAQEGYSSQDMMIWNSEREPVVAGRQNVAIFV